MILTRLILQYYGYLRKYCIIRIYLMPIQSINKNLIYLIFISVVFSSMTCQLPTQLHAATSKNTPTFDNSELLPTITSTLTITPPPSHSPSPIASSAPTLIPTHTPTKTYTPTRTRTSIPLSLTPGTGQITSGLDIWTLLSIEQSIWINIKGFDLSPVRYRHQYLNKGMIWLVLNFECTSRKSLTSLYMGRDFGMTLLSKRRGYPDVYLIDSLNRQYYVTFIGDCWLAAPVKLGSSGFVLTFLNLPPLDVRLP
jgi:hypothetical protein